MKGMKQKGEEGRGDRERKERGKKREAARWVPLPPSPPLLAEGEREREERRRTSNGGDRERIAAPLPPRVAVANARAVADHPGAASEAELRPEEKARAIATDGEGGVRTEKSQPPLNFHRRRMSPRFRAFPSPHLGRRHCRSTAPWCLVGALVADAGDRWLPKNTTVVTAEGRRSRALFWPPELPAEPQPPRTPLPPPSSTADKTFKLSFPFVEFPGTSSSLHVVQIAAASWG
ncbi:uncharacterized protein DS421_2g43590 [Arachis hypogaea]|nr:uncharacterized protein DS421_2g43590 [Arachis hypogaea]